MRRCGPAPPARGRSGPIPNIDDLCRSDVEVVLSRDDDSTSTLDRLRHDIRVASVTPTRTRHLRFADTVSCR
jgi:hypothetical protein